MRCLIKATLCLLAFIACLPLHASQGGRSFVVARDGELADIMALRDTLTQVTGVSLT